MEISQQRNALLRRLLPLIILPVFVFAVWVLHRELHQYHYHQIVAQFKAIPLLKVLSALALTILSYFLLTCYDHLAIRYIRHPLETGKIFLAAFVSYAFSNTIGFGLLAAGSIRYRLYSAWGLTAEEVARLVAFTVLTFWLGILTIGSLVFITEPASMPLTSYLTGLSVRSLGILFACVVVGYLFVVFFRKFPFLFGNWEFYLPTPRQAAAQLVIGALDWLVAGSVLFVLLPADPELTLTKFIGIYLLAQIVALISHVPGGLGVFESMVLVSTPDIPADILLGSMLLYRGIYYLFPLSVAAIILGVNELLQRKALFLQTAQLMGRWGGVIIPQFLAATTLASGAVMLFSAATPALPERLHWLQKLLPLPVIELSHFLTSLAGAGLLILARGLQRRHDAAYLLTTILLGAGTVFSLLKGADYEEAALFALMLLALLPCRRYFYRRTALLSEPFSVGWIIMVLLVVVSSFSLGMFSFKHVEYGHELWWHFALLGDAPRFLRGSVGVAALLLIFAIAKLLRAAPLSPVMPSPELLVRAKEIVDRSPRTEANLVLLGDKALLFDEQQDGFVMYGIEGRSWIALGDPVAPPETALELIWEFRELAERHGGQTVFYEVGTQMLHGYLDMGMTLFKLGEEARVDLAQFSLEGAGRKGLRYTYNRCKREGLYFDLQPATAVPELLPELKRISEEWLRNKNTREKGFSLGRFDENYLLHFPVALVRWEGKTVAFANLWCGADKQELSLDLMRFDNQATSGVMEYLFINLMLWGKEQGYQFFNLGMAPLSGLENRPFAPIWNRIGAVIFQQGEHFYNFEGLRAYKQKFDPVWEPRYLAGPGGLSLPRILLNIASLISGGVKGLIAK